MWSHLLAERVHSEEVMDSCAPQEKADSLKALF